MLWDTGTVHQDVHTAQLADGCIHHGSDVLGNSDICLQSDGSPSQFADLFGGTLGVLDVEIARRDIATEFREAESDRFTESDSRAGDQRHPPAEIEEVSSCRCFYIH